MYNVIMCEWLKMKRSGSLYCFLCIPLLLLIFTFSTLLSPKNPSGMYNGVPLVQISFFNLWPFILSHITIVLGIYYNLRSDEVSNWNLKILSNNWSLKKICLAKIIVLSIYLGLSYIILFLISIFSIYVITGSFQNIVLIFVTCILMFLAQVCLVPINILLLRYFNVLFILVFNLSLNFIFIKTILSKFFWTIPQSYGMKIATITMAINSNGTLLDRSSIYYNDLHALAVVLCCSFILFVLFTIFISSKTIVKLL